MYSVRAALVHKLILDYHYLNINGECGTGDRMIMQTYLGLEPDGHGPTHGIMHHPIYGWYEVICPSHNPISFALLF